MTTLGTELLSINEMVKKVEKLPPGSQWFNLTFIVNIIPADDPTTQGTIRETTPKAMSGRKAYRPFSKRIMPNFLYVYTHDWGKKKQQQQQKDVVLS